MYFPAEAVVLVPLLALAGIALRPRRAQAVALVAGLALVVAAFVTRLQPFALHTFLWAHLLQNVVLAEWAPALLVLAVPARVAARAAGVSLLRPLVALPLWLVTYFAWHLPWAYDFALHHPHSVLHVEHLTYLLAGVVHVVAGRPRPRLLRRESRVPLCGVRARVAARPRARARPARDLHRLRARATNVGAVAARRPADRRRHDGGGGGGRLLLRVRVLPACASCRRSRSKGAFDEIRVTRG